MQLVQAVIPTVVNVLLLGALPFFGYALYQKVRHRRPFGESASRAGLQAGTGPHLLMAAILAAAGVAALIAFPPPVAPMIRPGSPQEAFAGLGINTTSVAMAVLYGVVKTGFAEELLFRGLIAGSLMRRMRLRWANLLQAAIFLLPHLLILKVMPELWPILPLGFVMALVTGWLRARSGSIAGPWLIHAALNVTMCLSVAARTAA